MILVVWSTSSGRIDHWTAHETMAEAQATYKILANQDGVYSASICTVVESTDYEPYEELT